MTLKLEFKKHDDGTWTYRNLTTLQRYDDNRRDLAGDVARRVTEASEGRAAA